MKHNAVVAEDLQYINDHFTEKERLSNSRILVTGCAGFLGYYFLKVLIEYSNAWNIHSVVGIDNFRLGKPKWIDGLESQYKEKIKIHNFDIAKDNLREVVDSDGFDFIVHMASIASPTFYRKYPLATVDANVWGLRNLLDFYKDKKTKGLLFFSSSEIYGDPFPEFIPTDEEYRGNVSSMGPRACYDEAKRFGETICEIYAKEYGMPIIIVRPFNNYGPGMKLDDRRAPADFAQAVLKKEDIKLFSDGSPKRTFCYVADAILGYLKALTYGKFDYFNIGIDKPEISITDLAKIYVEKASEVMNYKINLEFATSGEKNYLVNNPTRRCPNIDKARKLLNYNPRIGINEGVEKFLQFLQTSKGEM